MIPVLALSYKLFRNENFINKENIKIVHEIIKHQNYKIKLILANEVFCTLINLFCKQKLY